MKRWFLMTFIIMAGCSFDPNVERPAADPDWVEPENAKNPTNSMTNNVNNINNTNVNNVNNANNINNVVDMAPDLPTDMPNVNDMANMPDLPTMCDGQVVDVLNSNTHCGECNNSCDPEFGQCRRGQCFCYQPYFACGDQNTCTLPSNDPKNCGRCGNECGPQEVCSEGNCICYPGFKRCNGVCVNIETDPANCGDCGIDCGGDACREGECRNNGNCGFGWFTCQTNSGPSCVQPGWNPSACDPTFGADCGTVCGPGELCGQESLIDRFSCRAYRPARGCTDCPCDDCQGEFCIDPDPPDVVYCVARD